MTRECRICCIKQMMAFVENQTAKAAGVLVWVIPTDEPAGSTPVDDMGADRVLGSFTELLELLPAVVG